MISIDRATIEDYKIIVDIGKVSVEEAHRDSSPAKDLNEFLEKNYNHEAIKSELSNEKNIYTIIKVDGRPAGFSKLIFNSEHANIEQKNVAKLDRIYLLREFFDLKLGYELLKFNIDLCVLGQSIWSKGSVKSTSEISNLNFLMCSRRYLYSTYFRFGVRI